MIMPCRGVIFSLCSTTRITFLTPNFTCRGVIYHVPNTLKFAERNVINHAPTKYHCSKGSISSLIALRIWISAFFLFCLVSPSSRLVASLSALENKNDVRRLLTLSIISPPSSSPITGKKLSNSLIFLFLVSLLPYPDAVSAESPFAIFS